MNGGAEAVDDVVRRFIDGDIPKRKKVSRDARLGWTAGKGREPARGAMTARRGYRSTAADYDYDYDQGNR